MAIGFNPSAGNIGFQAPQSTAITDTGTSDSILSLSQSQSIPGTDPNASLYSGIGLNPYANGTGLNPSSGLEYSGIGLNPTPANQRGAGAPGEDAGIFTLTGNQQSINAAGNAKITPKPNVLDQYASYTYSLGLYLITPQQFNDLKNKKPNFTTWTLLAQSGGAQANPATNSTSGRSPYFSLDYYIDDLTLVSRIHGGGTGAAHNVASLSFKVTEPNGLTFQTALSQAVQDLYKKNNFVGTDGNPPPYTTAIYVMVIKFYGYNDAGDLIQAGTSNETYGGTATGAASKSAQGAIVSKFYPFLINKLSFRLTTKNVEYSIEGAVPQYSLGASAARGSVPTNINLVGTTVSDILSGNGAGAAEVSPDDSKRSSTDNVPSPAPSTSTSVIGDLSTNQQTAISAGTDPYAVTDSGMAFGGGGLSG